MLVITRHVGERILFLNALDRKPLFVVEVEVPAGKQHLHQTLARAITVYYPDGSLKIRQTRDGVNDPFKLDHDITIHIKAHSNSSVLRQQSVAIDAPKEVAILRAELAEAKDLAACRVYQPSAPRGIRK